MNLIKLATLVGLASSYTHASIIRAADTRHVAEKKQQQQQQQSDEERRNSNSNLRGFVDTKLFADFLLNYSTEGQETIAETVCSESNWLAIHFRKLCDLLKKSPEIYNLMNEGAPNTYTLFATISSKFNKDISNTDDNEEVKAFLKYQITEDMNSRGGIFGAVRDWDYDEIETLLPGESITASISIDGEYVVLNGKARLFLPEIKARNGVIYLINDELLPPVPV